MADRVMFVRMKWGVKKCNRRLVKCCSPRIMGASQEGSLASSCFDYDDEEGLSKFRSGTGAVLGDHERVADAGPHARG